MTETTQVVPFCISSHIYYTFLDDTESKENDDDNLEGIVVTYKYLRQANEIVLKMLLQSGLFYRQKCTCKKALRCSGVYNSLKDNNCYLSNH